MPDGTSVGDAGRAVGLHQSGEAPCPGCGHPLKVTVGEGAALVTCTMRRADFRCHQKAAVIGFDGRLCLVVPISSSEFRALQEDGVTTETVLFHLGLLGATLTPAA